MARVPKSDPDFPQVATLSVILALGVLVIAKLLFFNDTVTISVQSDAGEFDAAGALAYGERIAQISEMTIATVLTLGAAVLGLNWYTSKRNFEDERNRIADYEERTKRDLEALLATRLVNIESAASRDRLELAAVKSDLDNFREQTNDVLLNGANGLAYSLLATFSMAMFTTGIIAERIPPLIGLMYAYLNLIWDSASDDVTKIETSKVLVRRYLSSFSTIDKHDISKILTLDSLDFLIVEITKIIDRLGDADLRSSWDQFISRLSVAIEDRSAGA